MGLNKTEVAILRAIVGGFIYFVLVRQGHYWNSLFLNHTPRLTVTLAFNLLWLQSRYFAS